MLVYQYINLLQQIAMVLAFCGLVTAVGFEPARKILVRITIAPIVYILYIVGVGLFSMVERERVSTSMIAAGGISAA